MRKACRHTVVYGKYVRSSAPGFAMGSISIGAVSLPAVVDEADDPRAVRAREVRPAPVRAVERDVELVRLLRLAQRLLEELAPLLDGEPVVLRVADDVRPAEVPGLERGRDGEVVVELGER